MPRRYTYQTITADPVADAERYYNSLEDEKKMLPKCWKCGKRIDQDEFYRDFEGDCLCDDCLRDLFIVSRDRYLDELESEE